MYLGSVNKVNTLSYTQTGAKARNTNGNVHFQGQLSHRTNKVHSIVIVWEHLSIEYSVIIGVVAFGFFCCHVYCTFSRAWINWSGPES